MDEKQSKRRPPGRKPGPGALDAYEEAIFAMLEDRGRTFTYAEIQSRLRNEHGVVVAASTLYGFVKRRAKKRLLRAAQLGLRPGPDSQASITVPEVQKRPWPADIPSVIPAQARRSSIGKSEVESSDFDELMREASEPSLAWKQPKK